MVDLEEITERNWEYETMSAVRTPIFSVNIRLPQIYMLSAWARDQQRVHVLTWAQLLALSKKAKTDLYLEMYDNMFHQGHKLGPIPCHLMFTCSDPFIPSSWLASAILGSCYRFHDHHQKTECRARARAIDGYVQQVALRQLAQYMTVALNIFCTCTLSKRDSALQFNGNNTTRTVLDEGHALRSTCCKLGKAAQKTSQLDSG